MSDRTRKFNSWTVFLGILCVIFLVIIIALSISGHKKSVQLENTIIGSYQTGNELEDGKYIIFDEESKYVYYQQFKKLGEGSYKQDEGNPRQYVLRNQKGKIEGEALLYGDLLYVSWKGEAEFMDFTKFSDTPTLINLKDDSLDKP